MLPRHQCRPLPTYLYQQPNGRKIMRVRELPDPDYLPALDKRYAKSQPAGNLPLGPQHPPRILLLYGSLRQRSYSRLVVEEAARLVRYFGGEPRIFDPSDLPLPGQVSADDHPAVHKLRRRCRRGTDALHSAPSGARWSSDRVATPREGADSGAVPFATWWVSLRSLHSSGLLRETTTTPISYAIFGEFPSYQPEARDKPSSSCSGIGPVPSFARLTPSRRIPNVTG